MGTTNKPELKHKHAHISSVEAIGLRTCGGEYSLVDESEWSGYNERVMKLKNSFTNDI